MKHVVITGATSGIGKAFAQKLSALGYKAILIGRDMDKLQKLHTEIPGSEFLCADLGIRENCFKVFESYPDADMIINSAGCGVFGEFSTTPLQDELSMIDINITALHILTKLYVQRFLKRGYGSILNIASSAAFFPGPLFSSYYSSKSYVYRLTTSIHDELKNTNINVSVLCPGPVKTAFNQKIGVNAGKGAVEPEYVVETALKNIGKRVIIPGFSIKCTKLASKLCPETILSLINRRLQQNKIKKQP